MWSQYFGIKYIFLESLLQAFVYTILAVRVDPIYLMMMNDERLADSIRRLCGLSCQNLRTLVSFLLSKCSGANCCSAHFTLEVSRPYLGLVFLID